MLTVIFILAGFGRASIPQLDRIPDISTHLRGKSDFLSVLVNFDSKYPVLPKLVQQALNANIPVFYLSTRDDMRQRFDQAFNKFRFCVLVPSNPYQVEASLVHAIWRHCVPVYNGAFQLSTMFSNGVVAWNDRSSFNITQLVDRIQGLNSNIRFLWSYQQILQETLWYRYGRNSEARQLHLDRFQEQTYQITCLAFVGIYSATRNRSLRDAIRATWGKDLVHLGIDFKFFVSIPETDPDSLRNEIAVHADIVLLLARDGYRNNSRKGLEFLKSISDNINCKFLIKTDDDIFWRPGPLLDQLRGVNPPLGYIWGFVDYISPVPRNRTDPFYNTIQEYPFPTFPTYPRGLVRVVSMDIVHALASKARKKELIMIHGDDPCFGVHLRQVVDLVPSIRIDDFASYTRFAMEPTCNPSAWRPVTNDTWIIHHVTSDQIKCLYENMHCTCLP
jgi:hypothetical protein